VLSVNYPLFNCVSNTLLKGIFLRGTIKKLGHGLLNRGKCQISDECSNNERLLLDEMHILKMVVKFCTKLVYCVSFFSLRRLREDHFIPQII
jgi:hypothetical protein